MEENEELEYKKFREDVVGTAQTFIREGYEVETFRDLCELVSEEMMLSHWAGGILEAILYNAKLV